MNIHCGSENELDTELGSSFISPMDAAGLLGFSMQ
jgi:hypothetical protein